MAVPQLLKPENYHEVYSRAGKYMKLFTKKHITFGITAVIILFLSILFFSYKHLNSQTAHTPATLQQQASYFSYSGKNGQNALTLLKENAAVTQDNSGLVVSINNRKADNTKHEYWAFYVNGKLANVGPADYITGNNDKVEWKIEKY